MFRLLGRGPRPSGEASADRAAYRPFRAQVASAFVPHCRGVVGRIEQVVQGRCRPRIARNRVLSYHAYFFTDTWTCALFS
jgi:hypothetical protein